MSEKAIAEVLKSDIQVNIFIEDEKEKNYNDSGEKQIDRKCDDGKTVQVKDQVCIDMDRRTDEEFVESKDVANEKCRRPIGQQTTWVQYSGYGGYGGGSDSAPLSYDPDSRNYFVKFVFIVLLIMLIITICIVAFILATPDIKEIFQANHLMFMLTSLGVVLMINYMMLCSECSRRPPCNFVCLLLSVIAMSIVVATVTCRIRMNLVFYAFIATAAVVAACILLACTSFDFTKWYLFVVVIAVAFAAVATIVSVTMLLMNIKYKPIHIALLLVGTILNVVILIIELQTILGGRAVEIGESDYALAAFLLYTSIIDLFLKIVQMMDLFDD